MQIYTWAGPLYSNLKSKNDFELILNYLYLNEIF